MKRVIIQYKDVEVVRVLRTREGTIGRTNRGPAGRIEFDCEEVTDQHGWLVLRGAHMVHDVPEPRDISVNLDSVLFWTEQEIDW